MTQFTGSEFEMLEESQAYKFEEAVNFLNDNKDNLTFNQSQQLLFYGYFKQATIGKCNTSKPSFFAMTASAKWNAWNGLGDMSAKRAKEEYVELLTTLVPSWYDGKVEMSSDAKQQQGMVVFSMPEIDDDSSSEDEKEDLCTVARDDDISRLKELLQQNKFEVNSVDEEGMTALHWACDRGNKEVAEILIKHGADVNAQDANAQTALHFACVAEDIELVKLLIKSGADKNAEDCDGLKPSDLVDGPELKQLLV